MKNLLIALLYILPVIAYSQNIPRAEIDAVKGIKVNSYTGNLFYQRNEMSLRGTDYRVYQSFNYNLVNDTIDNGYGRGWSFYYNVFYYTQNNTNNIIVQYCTSKKDTFQLIGGVYKSPVGVFDTLIKTGTVFTVISKNGEQHIFDNPTHKKVTRIQNVHGNFVAIEYANNFPIKVRNSNGMCLLLNFQNSHLADSRDSANPGKVFTYTYDSKGDLVQVTNPLNATVQYQYLDHALVRMIDENGSPVVITYSAGRTKRIVSCNTDQSFTFLPDQNKTFVTQKSQSGTITNGFYFDAATRASAISDADGQKTYFNYDSKNNLTEYKNFKGQSTKYAYDAKGNMIRKTDALGNISTYTYEPNFNNLSSITNKNGNTTTITYDGKGNPVTVVKPGNITESFTYDTHGRRITATDANGHTTQFQYNSDGDMTQIQYPLGSVQFQYNGTCCGVSKITDANGNTVDYEYDILGRGTKATDKMGNTVTYTLDAVGNLIKETDPNGIVKEYSYDGLNRLTSVKLKTGTWVYEYDEQNNITKTTDANGHSTKYEYNNKNQLIKETDPIGNNCTFSYDINGNLTARTYPNGNSIQYKYDDLNRLTEKAYNGNTDKYNYDAEGNLTAALNDNIAYTFEFDALNRMQKKNIVTWGKSISYTYDAKGNRTAMIDQDGGVTNYSYDANNRLSSLTNPSALTTSFIHDNGGRVIQQLNANGTFTTYHYDNAGRADSIINWKNNNTKISFSYYTFDQFGNRTSLTDKRGLHTYTYDSSYRLTKVVYADGTIETFAMDGSGNRMQRVKNGAATSYTYNNADQIQTAGNSNFSFDANGNTIAQTDALQKSYKYDGENRLVEVQLNAQKKVLYQYDPFGNKIIVKDTLEHITKMLYDANNLMSELSNSNSTVNKYTTAFSMDSWLSMNDGSNNFFYQKDGLNSTTELTNNTGDVLNEYNYDIFGNTTSQTGATKNNVQYTGRLFDAATQLYDYRARHYNTAIGRFINKDRFKGFLDKPLSTNNYTYTENNPVNYIDPSGFVTFSIGIGATFGGITGGVSVVFGPGGPQVQATGGVGFSTNVGLEVNAAGSTASTTNDLNGPGGQVGASAGEAVTVGVSDFYGQDSKNGAYAGTSVSLGIGLETPVSFGTFGTNTKCLLGCPPDPEPPTNDNPNKKPDNSTEVPVELITPHDPNEIYGTEGFDSVKQWVSVNTTLPYKVVFENSPLNATAPAQKVIVYLPIDSKLNTNAFRLSDFGFGSFNFTVPNNATTYFKRLDVRDSLGVFVDVTAGLDVANKRAFWIFESIDPATGLSSTLPANGGFLKVNDSITHRGEGFVSFTIQPSSLDKTGDTTTAQASVIFDTEDTIKTNVWVNTIDAVAPASSISALPATINAATFTIKCTATDDISGSGVRDYALYYSKDNAAYLLYQKNITADSIVFTGDRGSTYGFYTIATDNTGNTEVKNTAERTVQLLSDIIIQNIALSGCNNVNYHGNNYNHSIVVTDTIKNASGFDSVYTIATITINIITPVTHTTIVSGCNSLVFGGVTYTTTTVLRDTVKSVQGCDSVYNNTNININVITPTTQTVSISGCNSVVFKGKTFTASTVVKDTVKAVQGCDSIYNITNISVNTITAITQNINLNACNSIVYNGITYFASTIKKDTIKSVQGCDSIYTTANITITKITPSTQTASISGCNAVVFNGITYTSSTIKQDTIKSVQGCDSIYRSTSITVNQGSNFPPSVSISASSTNICQGVNVVFTATPTNGGTAPVYQWKKNGINAGTNANTYSSDALNNNDSISCELTSNSTCALPPIVLSNKIKMTVKASPAIPVINTPTIVLNCVIGTSTGMVSNSWNTTWTSSNTAVATVTYPGTTGTNGALINAVSNGSTVITVTVANAATGCSNSASVNYTVGAADAGTIVAANSVCLNSTTLATNSTPGGVWSTSNNKVIISNAGLVTGNSPGTAVLSYKVTNAGGCVATATKSITTFALPTAPTVATSTVKPYCKGAKFVLTCSPTTGVWTASNASVSAATGSPVTLTLGNTIGAASVTYTITDINGCTANRIISSTIGNCVGSKDAIALTPTPSPRISLYPNPAKGLVSLQVDNITGNGTIVITDIYGNAIKEYPLKTKGSIQTLDINGLSKGLYMVDVISGGERISKKLIVE